ncbi:MAG: fumarylacetoacetate hydrolase family protein [Thermoflexales bacterium]|nr:fumarylacetoacetate hydrolase family protein [Thermoflexales bacterium]MDW8352708.1 fumarylacetoacetate hydrolase family protein [Anaerolineae bacterium]
MKLVTYELDGRTGVGALHSDGSIADLTELGSVIAIVSDPQTRAQAERLAADPARRLSAAPRLRAPFTPRSFICIGLNYMDHVRESNAQPPARPVVFAKFANALAHPGDTITWYADATQQVDWEAELGVMIGKPCYRVSKEEAMAYVGGYTCVNDVSARDIQLTDSAKQFTLGKTLDGFCPVGPCLVTTDEIHDPQNLGIRCLVNGKVVQNSNTREMIFDVATLVSYLSKFMTLMPGDLIATGTPPGVGMGMQPPVWLKDGDEVTVEIERIGALTNTCCVR